MTALQSREQHRVKRQIRALLQTYGAAHLDLACHAAFPFAVTSELLYCLRENFVPEAPWIAVADLLLSSLFDSVGEDLYELAPEVRAFLLEHLARDNRFGEARLAALADFSAAYVNAKLPTNPRATRELGQEFDWLALACVRPGEAARQMAARLQAAIAEERDEERQRWVELIEGQEDMLTRLGLEPAWLWPETSEPASEPEIATDAAADWPLLQWLDFEVATLQHEDSWPQIQTQELTVGTLVVEETLEEENEIEEKTLEEENEVEETHRIFEFAGTTLQTFEFVTVTVDRTGREVNSRYLQAWEFTENLDLGFPYWKTRWRRLSKTVEQRMLSGASLEMVFVPGGSFLMGSADNDKQSDSDERPQHAVTIAPFFIGKYPVTQLQWLVVAVGLEPIERDLNPEPSSGFDIDDYPVTQVSWDDAMEFCARLSQWTGHTYRLPSEAEWEYACRAEANTPFSFGKTLTAELANYNSTLPFAEEPRRKAREETTPVGIFFANACGLWDMHGNVWEWCLDRWHQNYQRAPTDGTAWLSNNESEFRLLRGGSWADFPANCRSASRHSANPVLHDPKYGFRIVRTATTTSS